jgi:hypothetical protein
MIRTLNEGQPHIRRQREALARSQKAERDLMVSMNALSRRSLLDR